MYRGTSEGRGSRTGIASSVGALGYVELCGGQRSS